MNHGLLVCLVSGEQGAHHQLRKVLEEQGVMVRVAHSCAQFRRLLNERPVPATIFSDTTLPDGSWTDVVGLSSLLQSPVPVILVSRTVNIDLYISALENGASDFIVPPFYHQEIAHVLRCASGKRADSSDRTAWAVSRA